MSRFNFDAIGTSWEINATSPLGFETKRRILDFVEQFDAVYSRFREDFCNFPDRGSQEWRDIRVSIERRPDV